MTETEPTEREENAPVVVQDLDQFVHYLTCWHQARVRELEALLNIPEGTEVELEAVPPIILEGEVRRAFLAGIMVALMKLGDLPFQAEIEDASSVH